MSKKAAGQTHLLDLSEEVQMTPQTLALLRKSPDFSFSRALGPFQEQD